MCSCDKERKVPAEEKAFLVDQQTSRRMAIGCIDKDKTRRMNQNISRNAQQLARNRSNIETDGQLSTNIRKIK